jgi:hypothetical protein
MDQMLAPRWYKEYRQSVEGFLDSLTAVEMLNFLYLQAVYSLNRFYGCRIIPAGNFETKNEKICAEITGKGGSIVDMYKSGADALYCALLSEPLVDKRLLLKTVECYIPF